MYVFICISRILPNIDDVIIFIVLPRVNHLVIMISISATEINCMYNINKREQGIKIPQPKSFAGTGNISANLLITF